MSDRQEGHKRRVPRPSVMPVDQEKWAAELHLSNFVNAYYQYKDLQRLGDCHSVLVIGPGQGVEVQILRWRGYRVTTFDIDPAFKPDVIGSVHDLSAFRNLQFDAVIASHVLEHIAEPYLDKALHEISRIGRFALIYLPVYGVHVQLRLRSNFRDFDTAVTLDFRNWLHKPDGITARYMEGQHFWEVGMQGFRVRDLRKRISKYFDHISIYRNRDWLPSQNFVLRSLYKANE